MSSNFFSELEAAKQAAPTPFLEDLGPVLSAFRERASTPTEKAWCDIELTMCTWRTIHDTTEQMLGNSDWWRH